MTITTTTEAPSATRHDPLDLRDVLDRQRAAFRREGAPSLADRQANLKKLRAAVLARKGELAEAINADFGHRSSRETSILEILTLTWGIDYLRANVRRFMRPARRHVALPVRFATARIEYQPLGVIGIIAPWNYPLSLALMPLATALAAGNRAMIKPSEMTPRTSALMVDMIAATFAEDQVAVVTGDADVGAAFAALPFDKIVFTGSAAVGRAVMRAASENLVPVTLELGGKSPVIVDEEQPLDRVAAHIAFGKLANAGQTCVSPDYVLVAQHEVGRFVEAYQRAVAKLYPTGPASGDYASVVNEHHFNRLRALLDDAAGKGARVIEVGPLPEQAGTRPHMLAPTLVLDVNDGMRLMQEEIFGPVLPVVPYRTLDDAVDYVNAHPRPLALYYFGASGPNRTKVLTRTTSGNVTVNATLMHYVQDDLPFGGVGPSGMGAYHGVEGFRSLSHAKGVLYQRRLNAGVLLWPPFRSITNFILGWMLGRPARETPLLRPDRATAR